MLWQADKTEEVRKLRTELWCERSVKEKCRQHMQHLQAGSKKGNGRQIAASSSPEQSICTVSSV